MNVFDNCEEDEAEDAGAGGNDDGVTYSAVLGLFGGASGCVRSGSSLRLLGVIFWLRPCDVCWRRSFDIVMLRVFDRAL